MLQKIHRKWLSGPIAQSTLKTTAVLGVRLFVQAGTLLIVARMLGPEQFGVFVGVAALAVMLGAPLISLVSMTPVTINGLFLAEGAFVLVYASAGVPAEVALAAAIVRRLVDLANSGLGSGMWLAWQLGLRGTAWPGRGHEHDDAVVATARG